MKATLLLVFFWGLFSIESVGADNRRIQPFTQNPRYWQYGGGPVVLLGGSVEDNLFQIENLREHLELLASAGGNYIRNTMSARDSGNVQPFLQLAEVRLISVPAGSRNQVQRILRDKGLNTPRSFPATVLEGAPKPEAEALHSLLERAGATTELKPGRYDLERWNPEYWRRFENLLQWTRERGIIVQIEVWDRFDYSGEYWKSQAYNPANNVNYTYAQSGFLPDYPEHAGRNKQPFFFTAPGQSNNVLILKYQQRFVDKLLEHSIPAPNVLYCMDNETSGDPAWGVYWANYIRERAQAKGLRVELTEMWDDWNLRSQQHRLTLDNRKLYTFIDVSQNNHQKGEEHWRNFQWVRSYIASEPRPINTVKTYGADTGRYGTDQDGLERWWRHLIGGAAGVRFHRPTSGQGLNQVAQQHIRSGRMLVQEFDFFKATPDVEHRFLREREANEAYASAVPGKSLAIYFPRGGEVVLNLSERDYNLRWLDVANSKWSKVAPLPFDARLTTPGTGHWVALLSRVRSH